MIRQTGELNILFEGMTGNWEKDKVKFSTAYDDVMFSLKNEDLIDEQNAPDPS